MSGTVHRVGVRGFWGAVAHAPVLMTDPEKVHRYASDMGIKLSRWINGVVTYKEMKKLTKTRYFKRIESAFYGGGAMWSDEWENHVTTVGYNNLLDVMFAASAQTTQWYVGLTDGTPTTAITDTAASHAGWAVVTAYDELSRQNFTEGTASAGSIDNVGNTADFTISTNSTTVGGAFLDSTSTKSGTAGVLYAVGAFSAGDKSLDDGDTLSVTATFTAADDGV